MGPGAGHGQGGSVELTSGRGGGGGPWQVLGVAVAAGDSLDGPEEAPHGQACRPVLHSLHQLPCKRPPAQRPPLLVQRKKGQSDCCGH